MSTENNYAVESEKLLEKLSGFILIDRNRLDEALEQQSAYYLQVTAGVADAISYRDRAKADLEYIEAAEDRAIREAEANANARLPTGKDAPKPSKLTEGAIKALIVETDTYQDAKKLLNRWAYLVERWSGLKEAFSQRHFAMSKLTDLWIAGYFRSDGSAGSREPAGSRGENNYNNTRNHIDEARRARGAVPLARVRPEAESRDG